MKLADSLADRIIIPIIVSLQFLYCLLSGVGMLFLWHVLLLWLIIGVVSAIYLNSRKPWGRMLAAGWNASGVIIGISHGVRLTNPAAGSNGYLLLYALFATAYLSITALIQVLKGGDAR